MLIRRITLAKLPKWVLTNPHIAFNDVESVTAIEMVARLYGKMQELIEDYNGYVDQINDEIEKFESGITKTIEEFKECITNIMNDYIKSVDTKLALQDSKIESKFAEQDDRIKSKFDEQDDRIKSKFDEQDELIEEAIQYMKDHLLESVTNIFQEHIENGDIHVNLYELYEETPEFLTLGVSDTDFPTRNISEELDNAKGVRVTINGSTSSHTASQIKALIDSGVHVYFIQISGGIYKTLSLSSFGESTTNLYSVTYKQFSDGIRRLSYTQFTINSTGKVSQLSELLVKETE